MAADKRTREKGGAHVRRSPRRLLKGLLFVIVCLAIVSIVVYSPLFPVRSIEVTGNRYTLAADVIRVANIYIGEPIFQLETDTAARRLEKDLRIESAKVRRVMPGCGVLIEVVERRPIATIPCDFGYLDVDGDGRVLDAYRVLKSMPIPIITGIKL